MKKSSVGHNNSPNHFTCVQLLTSAAKKSLVKYGSPIKPRSGSRLLNQPTCKAKKVRCPSEAKDINRGSEEPVNAWYYSRDSIIQPADSPKMLDFGESLSKLAMFPSVQVTLDIGGILQVIRLWRRWLQAFDPDFQKFWPDNLFDCCC